MNISSLKFERDGLLRRCDAILNHAETERRGLTPSEQADFDAATDRIATINADLKGTGYAPGERISDDDPDPETAAQAALHAEARPLGAIEQPHISAMSSVKLSAYRNNRQGLADAHKVGRFFAATFLRHGPSARWCQENGIRVDVMAALSGGVNTSGGALVPDEMSRTVIELMDQYGAFRANADNLPMSSDLLTVPRRTGGLTAFYVGENQEGTESNASWDNVDFSAKKLMCLTRMSSEIAEDAIINLGDRMSREIALAFATKEDAVGFNGDGTSTYGGHVGVLVKALDASHTKAKVACASPHNLLAEVDADDLLNLMAAIPTYARAGSKWYCSPTALSLVFNAIMIAGGGNSMQNLANMPSPSFLGYPIVVTPVMADDAAADLNAKVMVAFGNLAMAATVATRREIRVQLSDQRYWAEDQIGVKGTMRHSIVAHDLGSATVKSPFAVLVGTT